MYLWFKCEKDRTTYLSIWVSSVCTPRENLQREGIMIWLERLLVLLGAVFVILLRHRRKMKEVNFEEYHLQ